MQLGVDPRGLVEGVLHHPDVRDLAAKVEVEQLEAVGHVAPLQLLEPFQDLANGETEFRAIAARALPSTTAACRQLDAHANLRPHPNLLRVLEDEPQLRVLLDDGDDVAAHLLREHHRLDVLGILEAVAHDRRVVRGHRHDRQQLGLAAGLEAELERRTEVQDFLDDLALLIHLDRVHAAVPAVVLVLGDRRLKRLVDVAEPVFQDVAEADEEREA